MPHPQVLAASPPRRPHAPPPFFAFSVLNRGSDVLVRVAGELDIASAPRLAAALRAGLAQAPLVVLDLRELTFIDSSGVHAIVDAGIRARLLDRRLIVLRCPAGIHRTFELTGNAEAVEFCDPQSARLAG